MIISLTTVYFSTILQTSQLYLRIGIKVNLVEEVVRTVSLMTLEKTPKWSGMMSLVLPVTVSFAKSL